MATRIKTKAADAPQTMAQVQSDIRKIGDLQREHGRISADLNDQVAKLTEAAAPGLKELQEQMTALQKGVQIYCEANREELCGKGKTANLVTGEVQWRQRPPSVKVTGVEAVIAWLKTAGMASFIRSKDEINKEAMLNEQEKAKAVPGVTIVTGIEDFVIVPFEVDTEVAA
jgi:phage host-nuclease inhibitor protein Gam